MYWIGIYYMRLCLETCIWYLIVGFSCLFFLLVPFWVYFSLSLIRNGVFFTLVCGSLLNRSYIDAVGYQYDNYQKFRFASCRFLGLCISLIVIQKIVGAQCL